MSYNMFKNIISRIKITFCCNSKCSLNEEINETYKNKGNPK